VEEQILTPNGIDHRLWVTWVGYWSAAHACATWVGVSLHRSHFCETGIHEGLSSGACNKPPEQKCRATVSQNESKVSAIVRIWESHGRRAGVAYVSMPSQLATHVDAKPSMVMKLKFR